ncbi:MAG: class I SAM-dependent methyltransferase [Saccharofermentans sp.]|nr:class I SAM-dependent methyltransferase [Saccharofermentans sp.]
MGIKQKIKDKLLNEMQMQVDALKVQLAQKDEQINQCNQRLDALENIINQDIRPNFGRIDNLENRADGLENIYNEYTRPNIEQLNSRDAELDNKINESTSNINGTIDNLSINLRNNNSAIEALQSDTEFVKYKLVSIEKNAKNNVVPAAINTDVAAPVAPTAPADSDYEEIDYFDFENHFRGSIDSIKKAQEAYIPYLKNKKNVLDIGCGRGEFLSLMQDNGINATGIDIYEPYADYCRMKGLNVTTGDGVAHLASLDEVDGIFVGQVVEHLKPHQIISLCNTAYEKLSEGGCIIIETPNPTSLSIYTNAFYIDPSHVKPVHPLTMKYYLEKAGFKKIEIVFTESSKPQTEIPALKTDAENIEEFNEALKKVSDIIFGSQDYAIIATK